MMPFAITLPLLTTNLLFCEKMMILREKKYDRIVENTLNTTNYVNGKK